MPIKGHISSEAYTQSQRTLRKLLQSKARKIQVATETLSADKTLAKHHRIVQFLDPGGSNRNIYLPSAVFKLDGNPWLKPELCENGECDDCPHIYTKPFPTDLYFHIFNMAGGAEDLVIKFKEELWVRENTLCNGGKYHDSPTSKSGETEHTVMTISQNKGGVVFCNGIIWRGFVASIT